MAKSAKFILIVLIAVVIIAVCYWLYIKRNAAVSSVAPGTVIPGSTSGGGGGSVASSGSVMQGVVQPIAAVIDPVKTVVSTGSVSQGMVKVPIKPSTITAKGSSTAASTEVFGMFKG